MKIAIVEDEIKYANQLEKQIERYSEEKNRLFLLGNVIKLRGMYKDLCIRNDAGVFFL